MTLTDEELDRDWKPNGRRPQSTIARSFSQELVDIFRIENSVADLDEQVNKRSQQINNHTSELEALEARIREMEQRLKQGSGNLFTDSKAAPPPPEKDYRSGQNQGAAQQNKYSGSRPGTARQSQQAVPGALPPTPIGSEGECHPAQVTVVPSRPRQNGTRRMEDDSASIRSMSGSATLADYVIVPRLDGDDDKDA
ncbi:hypothetical protein V8F06_011795 [Rhypophila decipiens]